MKFEQVDNGRIKLSTPYKLQPLPEVNKVYPCYDDGKIKFYRLMFCRITKIEKIENLDQDLINQIKDEIYNCYWLFDPEQTDIPIGKIVYENHNIFNGDTVIFLRTKYGGWFSINWFGPGKLDIDGSDTRKLCEGYNEKQIKKICVADFQFPAIQVINECINNNNNNNK